MAFPAEYYQQMPYGYQPPPQPGYTTSTTQTTQAGYYRYDPATGQYVPVQPDPDVLYRYDEASGQYIPVQQTPQVSQPVQQPAPPVSSPAQYQPPMQQQNNYDVSYQRPQSSQSGQYDPYWQYRSQGYEEPHLCGGLALGLGGKILDDDDWGDLDHQLGFAIRGDVGMSNWPVLIAIDVLGTYDEMSYYGWSVEGRTREIALGARWYMSRDQDLSPYVGGGIVNIDADIYMPSWFEVWGNNAWGPWLEGGVVYDMDGFHIGANLRYSQAAFNAWGEDWQVGGLYYGIFVGINNW